MIKIFSSRKFILAIVTSMLVGLNDALKLGLEKETINQIVLVVTVWIGGESLADAASAHGKDVAVIHNGNGKPKPPDPPAT